MLRIRQFLLLLLASSTLTLNAQNNEIKMGVRAGHNAAFGGFAAVSLETVQTFCDNFSISGGLQYNTIGKTAIEALPDIGLSKANGRISEGIFSKFSIGKVKFVNASIIPEVLKTLIARNNPKSDGKILTTI